MSNLYYNPEEHGLTAVAEIDHGGGWDFDKFVVWHEAKSGRFFVGNDSGCSCPSPFEDVTSVAELEQVPTLAALKERATGWLRRWHTDTQVLDSYARDDLSRLLGLAREAGLA